MEKSEEDGKEFRPHWERDGKECASFIAKIPFFSPRRSQSVKQSVK